MTAAYSQLMSRRVSKNPGRSVDLVHPAVSLTTYRAARRKRQCISKASRKRVRPRHTRRRSWIGRSNRNSCRSWR